MSYVGCITSDSQPPSRLWCLRVQSVQEFHQSERSPAVPWCKREEMTQQQEEITCSPSIKASLCKWRGGGAGGARRPARDHELKRRPGDGMMAWCHRALHIRHYQATSNSQSTVLDCGACRVPYLRWHCCEPFTLLTLEIDVLRSAHGWNPPLFAFYWVRELAREQWEKGKQIANSFCHFFLCQGLPRSSKCHTGYLGQAENRLGKQ